MSNDGLSVLPLSGKDDPVARMGSLLIWFSLA